MHQLESNIPLGGLNFDDNDLQINYGPDGSPLPWQDYRNAKNIRNAINKARKGKALTNVLGTLGISKYTLPYNNNIFPTGSNRCIGACEDSKYNTVLFAVWNSAGKHQILRYYRNRTDPNNPYGVVEQVMQYNWGWGRSTRITDMNIVYGKQEAVEDSEETGDLLYWSDPVPKKINITKGNIVGRQKSWNVFLPQDVTSLPSGVRFDFKTFNGAIWRSIFIFLPDTTSREAIIETITTYLNSDTTSPVTVESCGCFMLFTEKTAGQLWTIVPQFPQYLISPKNWYGATLIDRFFDRCKWQPMQAPQPMYAKDANYLPNYVQDKVFQFRLGYDYDDFEDSALGVWSQIAINNLGCDGASDESYNYVDVNFNDPALTLATTLVILRKVQFVARELNTGNDKLIITLDPCDFLDYDGTNWYCHFKFYNDIVSTPVDANRRAQLYDDVPLESAAELFVKNRMVEGATLVGYDAPECVEATHTIDFGEAPNEQGYTISGLIRLFNSALDNNASRPVQTQEPNILERRSGIFYDSAKNADYPFFGGAFYYDNDIDINTEAAATYKRQYLPEGGWPVYIAGTNQFAISKQIPRIDVAQRADGAIDVSAGVDKDKAKAFLEAFSNDQTDDKYDLFSTFELKNVKPGTYIIRLASHWCSFDDKLGKGSMYNLSTGTAFQKTSTFVWGVNDFGIGGSYRYDYEIKVTVTNSDVFVGEFIVADLVYPYEGVSGQAFYPSQSGYLYDANGNVDVPSVALGVTVERAVARNSGWSNNNINTSYQEKVSDHNGYFYFHIDGNVNGFLGGLGVDAYQVSGQIRNPGVQYYEDVTGLSALQLLIDETIGTVYPSPRPNHLEIICPTNMGNARQLSSTYIRGYVKNQNGLPLNGIRTVYEHGRISLTDTNGFYDFIAWGSLSITYAGYVSTIVDNDDRITDYLYFYASLLCQVSYPSGQGVLIDLDAIGPNPGQYNPGNPYVVADFIIDETVVVGNKYHKRGGRYIYVGRLNDDAGRQSTCFSILDFYVPFITEDLNKTLPDQYPAGTYKYGPPTINWAFAAGTTFPTWAKTFKWMRVKNTIYGRYLQWVVNQITYLSSVATGTTTETETSFENGDTVAIKMSITNIVDYASRNGNSQVGYQFQAGDRLRLILDSDINYYQGLYEFEILSFDLNTQSIIVKTSTLPFELFAGTMIEIYNPKSVATEDSQIFYEVGEVINITNGVPAVTSGSFTNGDTYWRGREILVSDESQGSAGIYAVTVEASSVSDFFPSEAQDIGRIGTIDPTFKQIWLPTGMRSSGQFLPGTASNGLSTFDPNIMPRVEIDRKYGQIMRLLFEQNNLVAVCSNKEVSNYINRQTLYNADSNTGVVSLSGEFFGTQYIHAQNLGTDLPASVVSNTGFIWGWNNSLANCWCYKGDGEAVISDVKAQSWFKELQESGVSDAVAVYDRYHEEYIITYSRNYQVDGPIQSRGKLPGPGYSYGVFFATGSTLPSLGDPVVTFQYLLDGNWYNTSGTITGIATTTGGHVVIISVPMNTALAIGSGANIIFSLRETISWYEGHGEPGSKRWLTFYDFEPENYCAIGPEIMSFVNGRIHIHGKGTVNNFYGVQYESLVTPVFNAKRELNKVWNALWMQQTQEDSNCNWYSPSITNIYGQQSRLKAANWKKSESSWQIPFLRDLGTTVVANPIVNGRHMRSEALEVEMRNDALVEFTLYGWRCNWTPSERTTK